MCKIAICILTLNEEKNIRHCLNSISKYYKEIHIIDSGSTDKTKEICDSFNVKFYSNSQSRKGKYSAATQRNWAMENIHTECEWFCFIDADEIVNKKFFEKLNNALIETSADVLCVPLLYYFHEKKIKSMGYPNWHDRIIKKGQSFHSDVGEYIDSENKEYLIDCEIEHNFNALGMQRFMEKQVRYAEYIGVETYLFTHGLDSSYFGKDSKNATLKRLSTKLGLFRPFARFIYQYFFKLGFCEGKSGFICAFYMAIFEFLVVVKAIEYKRELNKQKL